jgi:hypothetical protein
VLRIDWLHIWIKINILLNGGPFDFSVRVFHRHIERCSEQKLALPVGLVAERSMLLDLAICPLIKTVIVQLVVRRSILDGNSIFHNMVDGSAYGLWSRLFRALFVGNSEKISSHLRE